MNLLTIQLDWQWINLELLDPALILLVGLKRTWENYTCLLRSTLISTRISSLKSYFFYTPSIIMVTNSVNYFLNAQMTPTQMKCTSPVTPLEKHDRPNLVCEIIQNLRNKIDTS